MFAIADTSYALAVTIETEKTHRACLAVHHREEIIYLPQTVLAEIGYFLTAHFGNAAMSRFLIQLPQTKYRLVALEAEDILRTANLLQQYADTRVDFVDAMIAAAAERLGISRILTLDQRDFRIIRPKHTEFFEILPSV